MPKTWILYCDTAGGLLFPVMNSPYQTHNT